jgi:hypothetical protein
MMTKKRLKKATYFILIILVVVCFFISSAFNEPSLPVKLSPKPSSHISQITTIQIQENPLDNVAVVLRNNGNKPYSVKSTYPTQHFFDDNMCNRDEERMQYEPELNNAINRLSPQYKHHLYDVTEYLALHVYSTGMTKYFEDELTGRIKALHRHYLALLGISAARKITLHLVITPERSDYDHYTSFYAQDMSSTRGVYFGGLNIAFVDYQDSDSEALKTALHESVHILNAQILGKTPRMFNEGMAELYEKITIKNDKTEVIISDNPSRHAPYPLMQFFDDQQWAYLNTHQLYDSSKAWITFMHSSQSRLTSLIYFMKKEQVLPCSAFTVGESYATLQEVYAMFEIDFMEWIENQ